MAGRRSTGIEVFSLVASRELLGGKSTSGLVTLLHEHASGPYDLPLRIVAGLSAGHFVPYMHLGHEPELLVAPCLDFGRV